MSSLNYPFRIARRIVLLASFFVPSIVAEPNRHQTVHGPLQEDAPAWEVAGTFTSLLQQPPPHLEQRCLLQQFTAASQKEVTEEHRPALLNKMMQEGERLARVQGAHDEHVHREVMEPVPVPGDVRVHHHNAAAGRTAPHTGLAQLLRKTSSASTGKACRSDNAVPIDINTSFVSQSDDSPQPLSQRLRYSPKTDVAIRNTGLDLEVVGSFGSLELVDGHYDVKQLQIHFPPEHSLDGLMTAGELQIIHQRRNSVGTENLAVISVLLQDSDHLSAHAKENMEQELQFFEQLGFGTDSLPKAGEEVTLPEPVDLGALIGFGYRPYFHYRGSLPAPCAQNVQWYVLQRPVAVTRRMLDSFQQVVPDPSNSGLMQQANVAEADESDAQPQPPPQCIVAGTDHGCTCNSTWTHPATGEQGSCCSETSDKDTPWCYVAEGRNCPGSIKTTASEGYWDTCIWGFVVRKTQKKYQTTSRKPAPPLVTTDAPPIFTTGLEDGSNDVDGQDDDQDDQDDGAIDDNVDWGGAVPDPLMADLLRDG
mmetsp:Transcript_43910/g.80238  ORF Transcript_43910/g.80238 Transcript_43910/m.80238 type:complete len:535 (+) Transcript_43910:54-1658(+)